MKIKVLNEQLAVACEHKRSFGNLLQNCAWILVRKMNHGKGPFGVKLLIFMVLCFLLMLLFVIMMLILLLIAMSVKGEKNVW